MTLSQREGGGVVGNHSLNSAALIALIDIGTSKPKELAILIDSIGNVVGFPRTAGALNRANRTQQPVSRAAKGGGFQSESSREG